jgi:GNAT superfamily N-acetyltransferase
MLNIRPTTPADVPSMLRFVHELALYEREPDAVIATEADLFRDGFALSPDGTKLDSPIRFRTLIADYSESPNEPLTPAGFALFFTSYSTWRGHHGIRLEDLYVTPSLRGKGIGRALLTRLAQIAVTEGCPRLEWDVLDWNTPAIAVYEKIGARMLNEWRIMRLADGALRSLAANAS